MYEPLQDGDVLTEGMFVFPAFRRRGVAASMLRASAAELARRGHRRCLAVIDVQNRASLRAFHAAGFTARSVMRVDVYRLGQAHVAVRRDGWRDLAALPGGDGLSAPARRFGVRRSGIPEVNPKVVLDESVPRCLFAARESRPSRPTLTVPA